MVTGYNYELWNGREVVGVYNSMSPLFGDYLVVPQLSIYKQPYNRKMKLDKFNLEARYIKVSHSDTLIRIVIDVRRKSKRQIERLCKGGR